MKNAKNKIEKELEQLDIPKNCKAYEDITENALEASEIMNWKELKDYINEYEASLPNYMFQVLD
jgi:hypothetical protein